MTRRETGRRIPVWLAGLLIAVIVFALVLLVSSLLGVGDDPVVEGAAALSRD